MYLSFCSMQVRIVLEGVDKFSNLTGSVYYPDGESAKDLAFELIENVSHSRIMMLILIQFIVSFCRARGHMIAYALDELLLY